MPTLTAIVTISLPLSLDYCCIKSTHYDNMPMQCTVIFHGCKNDTFQMKKCKNFHIFAQNIDCGYM